MKTVCTQTEYKAASICNTSVTLQQVRNSFSKNDPNGRPEWQDQNCHSTHEIPSWRMTPTVNTPIQNVSRIVHNRNVDHTDARVRKFYSLHSLTSHSHATIRFTTGIAQISFPQLYLLEMVICRLQNRPSLTTYIVGNQRLLRSSSDVFISFRFSPLRLIWRTLLVERRDLSVRNYHSNIVMTSPS